MTGQPVPGDILLVDAGSTNVKWSWWRAGVLGDWGAVRHENALAAAVARIPAGSPGRILVASVLADSYREALADALFARFAVVAEFAEPEAEGGGVVNAYRDPRRMGVDRWLALRAAWVASGCAGVVADCGTAVTIDVIGSSGRHLGGQILPGLAAMRRCLAGTTRLTVDDKVPAGVLGRDTAECVASGIHHAVAAAVERAAAELPVNTNRPPGVMITGGDAAVIASLVRIRSEIRPHLVLEGLALWAGLGVME